MDVELQTLIFMGLILKIPVVGMLWLVWWAWKSEVPAAEAPGSDDGHEFRRWRRSPTPPRRGPHGPGSSEPAQARPARRDPHQPASARIAEQRKLRG